MGMAPVVLSRKRKATANTKKNEEKQKNPKLFKKTKETEYFFQKPETKTITNTGKGNIHTN